MPVSAESHSREALLIPKAFQLSEEPRQHGIKARIPFIQLVVLTFSLQPENTPIAVTKTWDMNHGCSGSADSWPDQKEKWTYDAPKIQLLALPFHKPLRVTVGQRM